MILSKSEIALFICLLTGNVLGDFIFQSSEEANNKSNRKILLIHSSKVALISYLICGIWANWQIPLTILILHLLIDYIKEKISLKNKNNEIPLFLIDQTLHLIVIITITKLFIGNLNFPLYFYNSFGNCFLKFLIIVSGGVLVTKAGSILIGLVVKPYQDQIKTRGKKKKESGLIEGGKIIGILERSFIYIFVIIGEFTGIGFLIATKSILRFGEISNPENRKLAEYVIIGTFSSFLYGLLISLFIKYCLSYF